MTRIINIVDSIDYLSKIFYKEVFEIKEKPFFVGFHGFARQGKSTLIRGISDNLKGCRTKIYEVPVYRHCLELLSNLIDSCQCPDLILFHELFGIQYSNLDRKLKSYLYRRTNTNIFVARKMPNVLSSRYDYAVIGENPIYSISS